jgi:hypothetical protein
MCVKHYKRWYKGQDLNKPDREPIILPKEHPVYLAWTNMKTRCDNPKSTQYKWYGARGIHYCEEWKFFKNFYADMFEDWHLGLMLDRKRNNEGYSKDNCRWVTPEVSANNRRLRGTC